MKITLEFGTNGNTGFAMINGGKALSCQSKSKGTNDHCLELETIPGAMEASNYVDEYNHGHTLPPGVTVTYHNEQGSGFGDRYEVEIV